MSRFFKAFCLFLILIASVSFANDANSVRIWEKELAYFELAKTTTIKKMIPLTPVSISGFDSERTLEYGGPIEMKNGINLNNFQVTTSIWGSPEQLTMSLRKTDVWDRRFPDGPIATLEQIRHAMFDPNNSIFSGHYIYVPNDAMGYRSAYSYAFPLPKPVGQIILGLPDFAGIKQPEAIIDCSNGSANISMKNGNAEAKLTYINTMGGQNIIGIRAELVNTTQSASVRIYRHKDTCVPGKKYEWDTDANQYKLTTDNPYYDYSKNKDSSLNTTIDPPKSGADGRFFWIQLRMPPEKTFPKGFEYALVGLISGEPVRLEVVDGQHNLGTPQFEKRGNINVLTPESAATGSAATAKLPIKKEAAFTAFFTVVTSNDTDELINEAKRRLLEAESKGIDGLAQSNATWYQQLYDKRENGRIFTGAPSEAKKIIPSVFKSWGAAHTLCARPDPTRFEAYAWYYADVFDSDCARWNGLPCYNELYFTHLNVINRSDVLDYYPKLVSFWHKASIDNAKEVFDLPGMFGPAHGYLPPVKPDKYVHSTSVWEFCMEIPAQVMKIGWDIFDYGGDEKYLADVVYPSLRELAIFYSSYVTLDKDDGLYHVIPSVSAEHWHWTYRYEKNCDSAAAIAMFKWTFKRAAEAAEILGRDSDLAKKWLDIAGKMAPYPTWWTLQGPIFTDMAGGIDPTTNKYNWFGGVVPTVLADEINLDSNPADIQTMLRTGQKVDAWLNKRVYHLLAANPNEMNPSAWGEGLIHLGKNLNLEEANNLKLAVYFEPERLINSRSGKIHLFPCVPRKATIAFKGFQARGGFEVSAEMVDGKTTYVLIKSRRNIPCHIWNPWPGSTAILYRNGKSAERINNQLLQFQTTKGETIEISNTLK